MTASTPPPPPPANVDINDVMLNGEPDPTVVSKNLDGNNIPPRTNTIIADTLAIR
jgi:hypothetical protein|tara:strand:+ start:794 stop:958 length:165 start_codon:yes stop_codon:yes gene_type:complete